MKKLMLSSLLSLTGIMAVGCGPANDKSETKTVSHPYSDKTLLFASSPKGTNWIYVYECGKKPFTVEFCSLKQRFDGDNIETFKAQIGGGSALAEKKVEKKTYEKLISDTVAKKQAEPNKPAWAQQEELLMQELSPIAAEIDAVEAKLAFIDSLVATIRAEELTMAGGTIDAFGSNDQLALDFLNFVLANPEVQ